MFNNKKVYCVMHHVDTFEHDNNHQFDETLELFRNYKDAQKYVVDIVSKSVEPEFCIQDDWNCYTMYTDISRIQHIFEIKTKIIH